MGGGEVNEYKFTYQCYFWLFDYKGLWKMVPMNLHFGREQGSSQLSFCCGGKDPCYPIMWNIYGIVISADNQCVKI